MTVFGASRQLIQRFLDIVPNRLQHGRLEDRAGSVEDDGALQDLLVLLHTNSTKDRSMAIRQKVVEIPTLWMSAGGAVYLPC
jgi:polygalacturonase